MTFKFTLPALSTQLATTQLPRSELERAFKLLNSINTIVSKAASCGDFELFPELPIELRLRIWGYAAWHPRVIAIKDDYNPTHMALCGSNARCPLVRVNKEAREDEVKTKMDFNARCQIDGAPKIWANLAVDTIWIMNWKWSPWMSGGSTTSSWNKCKGSSLSSVKKLAMCQNLIVNFFDISAENRVDELHIEEVFVLTNAEDGVLDVDTIQLIEPKRSSLGHANFHPQFDAAAAKPDRRHGILVSGGKQSEKQIKAMKAHFQDLFIRKTNGNGPTGALGALLNLQLYDYLRDLSKWKIPRVRCRAVALFSNAI